MLGKLQHIDAPELNYNWVIEFIPERISGNKWIQKIPVHPDSTHYMFGLKAGKTVEFELVYDESVMDELFQFAKITNFDPPIKSKEPIVSDDFQIGHDGAFEFEEEIFSYLPSFINQFETELDPHQWDVLEYLKWLNLNGFKIVK
jgi:hypothetical protein